jgi:uncharacterized protein YndB with AHSA1/START domain
MINLLVEHASTRRGEAVGPHWDESFDRLDDHLRTRMTRTTRSQTMTESTSTVTAEGLTITRVFDAPRQLVWSAWTDPTQFAQWFGGKDATVPAETLSFDVRPGGRWNAVMHTMGMEIPWKGQFLEVDPPERLVLTMEDAEGGTDNFETLTVELRDLEGKTEMHFSQLGGNLTEEQYHQTVEGYGTFFDAMDEVVAGR